MFVFFFPVTYLNWQTDRKYDFLYSNLEGFSCHLPVYNSNKNHVAQRNLVLARVSIAFFVFLLSLLKINIRM